MVDLTRLGGKMSSYNYPFMGLINTLHRYSDKLNWTPFAHCMASATISMGTSPTSHFHITFPANIWVTTLITLVLILEIVYPLFYFSSLNFAFMAFAMAKSLLLHFEISIESSCTMQSSCMMKTIVIGVRW